MTETLKSITSTYEIRWDASMEIARCMLCEGFDHDSAVRLKEDVTRLTAEVRQRGISRIRVLHDVTRLPDTYQPDSKTKAILWDVMDLVDVMATFGTKPGVREVLRDFFDTASFLFQGKKMVFFDSKEEAEAWLRKV